MPFEGGPMPFEMEFSDDRESATPFVRCDAADCVNVVGQDDPEAEPFAVFGVPEPGTWSAIVYIACSAACRDRLRDDLINGEQGWDDPVDDASSMPFKNFWQMAGRNAGLETASLLTTQDIRQMEQVAALIGARPEIPHDM